MKRLFSLRHMKPGVIETRQQATSWVRQPVVLVAVAALVYGAIYVGRTYPLVTHLSTHAVIADHYVDGRHPASKWGPIIRNDLRLSIWGAAHNARAFLHGRFNEVFETGHCYPTPKAGALGEHMIDLGLLAMPGYLISMEPVVAYNVACMLLVMIAGAAMFALIYSWTRCFAAAFFAGLFFAFHPARMTDLVHPAVVGLHWLPLVILYFDRLVVKKHVRHGVLLAVWAILQSFVGAYPLLIFAVFCFTYFPLRLFELRASVTVGTIAALAAVAVLVLTANALVLAQYIEVQSTWNFEPRIFQAFEPLSSALGGARWTVGVTPLAFAIVLFVPRIRAKVRVPLGLIVAGTACALLASNGVPREGATSLFRAYTALAALAPPLESVRAPLTLYQGLHFSVIALAGLGLGTLFRRKRSHAHVLISTIAPITLAAIELFYQPVTRSLYASSGSLVEERVAPSAAELEPYEVLQAQDLAGAVLDVPFSARWGWLTLMPKYMLLSAYHRYPIAACYNSYTPPSYYQIAALASRLPSERAVRELSVAGLRNIVLHKGDPFMMARLAPLRRHPAVKVIADTGQALVLRLPEIANVHEDLARLHGQKAEAIVVSRGGVAIGLIAMKIENTAVVPWSAPRPYLPLPVQIRFVDARSGRPGPWLARGLALPLALDGGAIGNGEIRIGRPERPGDYFIELDAPALGFHARLGQRVRFAEGRLQLVD